MKWGEIMASYHLGPGGSKRLEDYVYGVEGRDECALQMLLEDNPEIITSLPELELAASASCFVCREYPTSRGLIDLLIITEKAEIVIVETKLIKNPESSRTVVAQAIDYIKALSNETVDRLVDNISKREKNANSIGEKIKNDDRFRALLSKNIEKGNFRTLIVGDLINSNILGMVESIQSAPHLAFTIYLVELNAAVYDGDSIIVTPKVVANTVEVERSVIKIEIADGQPGYKIESEAPSKGGKGSKPILSWDEYLSNVADKNFVRVIEDFRGRWIAEVGESINMGQVGFSAGVMIGDKRIPVQMVYDRYIEIISEKSRESYKIPQDLYREYKEDLKRSPELYDKYLIANKVVVRFEDIDPEVLALMLTAALDLAKKMKNAV